MYNVTKLHEIEIKNKFLKQKNITDYKNFAFSPFPYNAYFKYNMLGVPAIPTSHQFHKRF